MNDTHDEQLSAFLDDELDGDQSRFLLRRIAADAALARRFDQYVTIGEALRGLPVGCHDLAARVRRAMAEEAAAGEAAAPPGARPRDGETVPEAPSSRDAGTGAAPAAGGWFARLRPVASVATAAAIAAVVVTALLPPREPGAGPESAPTAATFSTVPAPPPAEPRLIGVPGGRASFASYLVKHDGVAVAAPTVRPTFYSYGDVVPATAAASAGDAASDAPDARVSGGAARDSGEPPR